MEIEFGNAHVHTHHVKIVLVQPELRHVPGTSNLEAILRTLAPVRASCRATDIVVLPEHHDGRLEREPFEQDMAQLARDLGCHVVAGTQHVRGVEGGSKNAGACFDPAGHVLARYEKHRPYGLEQQVVAPGRRPSTFEVAGRKILVMVCADFWFSDVFLDPKAKPDVVLVPALSVTRGPTPDYSRALWKNLAITRAYEFGVYVGISDWAASSKLPQLGTAGVAGFADPTTRDPRQLFRALDDGAAASFDLDFEALNAFHEDRRKRGFFWREG